MRTPETRAGGDGAAVISVARWTEETVPLSKYPERYPLPQLARASRGQYFSIGAPSLASPALCPTFFLTTAPRLRRILAQGVRFKEGRRAVPTGPPLLIPESFEGYFEILSEDGRAVRCFESVTELSRRFPDSCLVREPIRALVSRSDNVDSITERARTIPAGETLVLVGEVMGRGQHRFLRCFDSRGHNVFLPYGMHAKFSPVAKEDNISGVHTAQNLLSKRLPLMVRMVHGKAPVGTKPGTQLVAELRLMGVLDEECMVAMPLPKETHVLYIPRNASLKIQSAKNSDSLKSLKEWSRLCEKCNKLISDTSDRIHIFDINISKDRSSDIRFVKRVKSVPVISTPQPDSPPKSLKDTPPTPSSVLPVPTSPASPPNAAEEYDEIDQIYDYVRGFAPLPKNIRNVERRGSSKITEAKGDKPPDPPPIETIPTRKNAFVPVSDKPFRGEKRTRKGSEKNRQKKMDTVMSSNGIQSTKMYVKAGNVRAQKPRILRHKSVSPMKEPSKTSSPLFQMRYKSLTNLAGTDPPLGQTGTLDSSNSGTQLPEKRSRGAHPSLIRPRSLTDLVAPVKGHPSVSRGRTIGTLYL